MPTDWTNTTVRHGTRSGWALHQSLAERPCTPCYLAKKNYDKAQKLAPERKRKARLNAAAQGKAYVALAHAHPEEYRKAYQEAKARIFKEAGYDE